MDFFPTDLPITFCSDTHFQASKLHSVNKFQGFTLRFLFSFLSMIHIPTPHLTKQLFLELLDPYSNCPHTKRKLFRYSGHPHFSSLCFLSFCYAPSEMRELHCTKYLRDALIMHNNNLIPRIICSFQNHQALC